MNDELYKKATAQCGKEKEIIICIEELSELQKELCKELRSKGNIENIAEEIADAAIMLEQLQSIFDCEDKVNAIKEAKIKRLKQRLTNGTA